MNLIDYLENRGDLSFESDPFNDVDNLLCALLSYLDFSPIVPSEPGEERLLSEAVTTFFDRHAGEELHIGAIIPDKIFEMARRMAESKRFAQTRLTAYRYVLSEDKREEKQWTALVLLFEDDTAYISFAGTDDTLVSWKENLNMAVIGHVPSQTEAADYAKEILGAYPNFCFRIGGHSKGGNLALYAAAKCPADLQERILCVYNDDGPGFTADFLADDGYKAVRQRVRSILPELSIVGLMFESDLPAISVKSSAKGVFQHDGFSWQVTGCRFEEAEEPAKEALLLRVTIRRWLASLTPQEKADFVDAFYKLLTASDAKTLTDLFSDKLSLLSSYRKLSAEDRRSIKDTAKKFLKAIRAVLNAPDEDRKETDGKETDEKEQNGLPGQKSGETQGKSRLIKTKDGEFVTAVDGASLYSVKPKARKKNGKKKS